MTSSRTFTPNQISRLARQAIVAKKASGVRLSSTEPSSKFVNWVENQAGKPAYCKRSVIYHTLGDRFPYLQMFAASADFEFLKPSQIAGIYIVARARPEDWHLICAQPNSANYAPNEELVETVNGYFAGAGAPLADELHEMCQMFDTFMKPHARDVAQFQTLYAGERLQTVAFLASVSGFETKSISCEFRQHEKFIGQRRVSADRETCSLVFRTFRLDAGLPRSLAQADK